MGGCKLPGKVPGRSSPARAASAADHLGDPFVTLGALRPGRGGTTPAMPPPPRARQRGQSLTEFALLLPILLLLTVAALDFGRVYLGYINIQNMARIAANYAANNPLAWTVDPDAGIQERYENQILQDASATNCNLPVVGETPVIPDPIFTNIERGRHRDRPRATRSRSRSPASSPWRRP